MGETLLGISSEYLYIHGKEPKPVEDLHSPHFLVFSENDNIEKDRKRLIELWKSSDATPLRHIKDIGEIETYRSFWDFKRKIKAFRVYIDRSFLVPEVSDYLFFNLGFFTAEHDIPYHQRALIDLAVKDKVWILDTEGARKDLKILVYDIETTEFEEGRTDLPIDILGYSSFEVSIESEKDLDEEEFYFEIKDMPSSWEDCEVVQLISRNEDEEIENLLRFCEIIERHDIISGHNIVGFDNRQIHGRIERLLKERGESLSRSQIDAFNRFLNLYSRKDKSFHFGVGSEIINLYPSTFDTYLGVRKFYPHLDDFSLKSVALFLDIRIKDRIYLMPNQIRIDERTLKYNEQDVKEQAGVTINLLEQALPLAFTTCMSFDMLLESGAVNMWDHMAMIRATKLKKIIPPLVKALHVSENILKFFPKIKDRKEIARMGREKRGQLPKDLIRVIKYGSEMPEWVEYPEVIFNPSARDKDEVLNYHIPGGMTIKPDKDARSHFIPWYYVVVADVSAMYPTILKAMNLGADVVRLARKDEIPDYWIWMKKVPREFLERRKVMWKEVDPSDSFADSGYMIGIRIDEEQGVVNRAMSGIMNVIYKIKEELKRERDPEKKRRLKMIYQSLKGARNAGTHGILSAPTVAGRQFNIWGAAAITTRGQEILFDTLRRLKEKGIRIVYGDTDGIYLACSRSMGSVPDLARALGLEMEKEEDHWITKPEIVYSAIRECSELWKKKLRYQGFELEAEKHDAMIFVKHKNYLIFDGSDGKVEMITKGNNFRGSDKANIARKVLERIMIEVLKENSSWRDEEEARRRLRESIKKKTREIVGRIDLSNVDIDDLTLVQSVQPSKRYQLNKDGSMSSYGRRAKALENLLGEKIKTRVKFKFVVTKRPLPGIPNPSKSGVKPIDYMYPIELIKDLNEIDLDWYKDMIQNFVKGAFGLTDLTAERQRGLDAWM